MGDHRAECHITFEIHGKTYKLDLDWVNWFDPQDEGIDSRVREFFAEAWSDAYWHFQEDVRAAEAERNKAETEKRERAELERLKAKYEPAAPRAARTCETKEKL